MDYASRMQAGTRNIYYLCTPNRHLAEHSPYYEAMKQKNMEVSEQWGRLCTHPKEGLCACGKWLNVPRMWTWESHTGGTEAWAEDGHLFCV